MTPSPITRAWMALLMACVLRPSHAQTPELFLPGDSQAATLAAAPAYAQSVVTLNRAVLQWPLQTDVNLTLPGSTTYTAVFERQVLYPNGDIGLVGFLKDYGKTYRITLTVGSSSGYGRIETPEGVVVWEAGGTDGVLLDLAAAGITAQTGAREDLSLPPQPAPPAAEPTVGIATAHETVVDVLVLYSSGVATKYPGGELQTRLNQLFSVANTALADSGVGIVLNMVHSAAIDYADTATDNAALDALTTGNAPFDVVAALRDQYNADLVTFIRPFISGISGVCGKAWLNGAAGAALDAELGYSVVREGADGSGFRCEDLAMAHMLGHNMGSAHDAANADIAGHFDYSYGHGQAGQFGTVMSFIAPTVSVFSNPAISTCANRACGVTGSADNALSLNNLRDQIAAFRGTGTQPTAPQVSTAAATAVTDTGATLNGTVNPNGQAVTAYFEYGTSTAFGSQTPAQNLTPGNSDVAVTATLTGLACNTYYFRMVAEYNGGAVQGAASSFTNCGVSQQPPVFNGVLASAGSSTAQLSAATVPGSLDAEVHFEYGIVDLSNSTASTTVAAGTQTVSVAIAITGLTCEATYRYRAVAVTASDTVFSDPQTFTTDPCAQTLAPVQTLQPQNLTPYSARLRGSVTPERGVSTVVHFEFGATAAYGSTTQPENIGDRGLPQTVVWDMTGLECATAYHYRVVATPAAGGNPVHGDDVAFPTLDCPLPEVREEITVWINPDSAVLRATIDPKGKETTAYFEYGESPSYGQSTAAVTLSGLALQQGITGLTCNTTYYFRAVAENPDGSGFGAGQSFNTKPCPAPPAVLTQGVADITATSAVLNASVNSKGETATVYFDYGTTENYGQRSAQTSVGAGFADTPVGIEVNGLDCDMTYHYRVAASNAVGNDWGADAVFTTGPCGSGSPPAPTLSTRLGAGADHSVAIRSDGTLVAWGANDEGQLGTDPGLSGLASILQDASGSPLGDIVKVTAGHGHTLALDSQGIAYSWGDNGQGQLANGSNTSRYIPDTVKAGATLPLTGIIDIAAGEVHSLALTGDGRVLAWGGNDLGQLGTGTATGSVTPITILNNANITALAAGARHSLALKNDGEVLAWGDNGSGQLGYTAPVSSSSPQPVPGVSNVQAIAAGDAHSLALKSNGSILTWGDNSRGQLGTGGGLARTTPAPVRDTFGGLLTGFVAIAAGDNHSVALRDDGTVWAWGSNSFGQLGDGTRQDRPGPVVVLDEQDQPLRDIVAIAAGRRHTVILRADGRLLAWGDNSAGQLGRQAISRSLFPAAVMGDAGRPLALTAAQFEVAPATLVVDEGSTATVNIRLSDAPFTTVQAAVSLSGDAGVVIASGAALSFTAENWDIWQSVQVEAVADDDAQNASATLTISAPDLDPISVSITAKEPSRATQLPRSGAVDPGFLLLLALLFGLSRRSRRA